MMTVSFILSIWLARCWFFVEAGVVKLAAGGRPEEEPRVSEECWGMKETPPGPIKAPDWRMEAPDEGLWGAPPSSEGT